MLLLLYLDYDLGEGVPHRRRKTAAWPPVLSCGCYVVCTAIVRCVFMRLPTDGRSGRAGAARYRAAIQKWRLGVLAGFLFRSKL